MIKIGVFGAGHLGKIHIKLLKEIEEFQFIGFYDPNEKVAREVEERFGVKWFQDQDELIGLCDAIDIVTPTMSHHQVATMCMRKFKHVFIEKPISSTLEEAESLINLAREAGVKAQVGHVERFNPAFLALRERPLQPLFIDVQRLAQWNPRGTDVSVVHDLMIHDIDIILSIVKSPIRKISATGVAVISQTPDIANARIEFNNGAVANLTASRIHHRNLRDMHIYQRFSFLRVDFLDKKVEVSNITEDAEALEYDPAQLKLQFMNGDKTKFLTYEEPKVEPVNAIKMELEEFAKSIINDTETMVTLEDGGLALQTAQQIMEKINNLCVI